MGSTDELLAEQIAYYRARAPEYFDGVIPGAVGGGELEAALDAFRPAGDFWLSHVPLARFEAFWSLVAQCLAPAGRVFFADDCYRTAEELIEGESSSTIRRRLNDGSPYRAVKVPHEPAELEERLARLGWRIAVTPTSGPFFWGVGSRA